MYNCVLGRCRIDEQGILAILFFVYGEVGAIEIREFDIVCNTKGLRWENQEEAADADSLGVAAGVADDVCVTNVALDVVGDDM